MPGHGALHAVLYGVGHTPLTSCLPGQDRPLFARDGRIIFASTHRPAKMPRQGWTAIYSLSGGAPQPDTMLRTYSQRGTSVVPQQEEDWCLATAALPR